MQLANAVRDCGLLPGLPTPDHAKAEDLYPSSRPSSPPSSSPEFDSTGCWGEVREARVGRTGT